MRLGVKARAVIALTGWWLLIATPFFESRGIGEEYDRVGWTYQMCENIAAQSPTPSQHLKCDSDMKAGTEKVGSQAGQFWLGAFLLSAVLALAFWLFAAAVYASTRWVLRGRDKLVTT